MKKTPWCGVSFEEEAAAAAAEANEAAAVKNILRNEGDDASTDVTIVCSGEENKSYSSLLKLCFLWGRGRALLFTAGGSDFSPSVRGRARGSGIYI
jgi:hypothetical protein